MKTTCIVIAMVVALGLCAVMVSASPDLVAFRITNASIGTNASKTDTSIPLSGYLDSVTVFVQTANTTGNVSVVILTNEVYTSEITLYTNAALTAHTTIRPRFCQHNTAGSTNPILERLLMYNAKLQFRVGGLTYTNRDYRSVIIFDNARE